MPGKYNPANDVTIIIVTHSSEQVVKSCLDSIPKEIRVLLVDNASRDYTVAVARKAFPSIEILYSNENMGFGRANNMALQQVKTPFALLLNPDSVLEQTTIQALLDKAIEQENAAIIAPTLVHEDGKLQQSYKASVFYREKNKTTYIEPCGDVCADCLSGAAMLLRMDAFAERGFFDPNIFLFYEDDDICLQARKAGYALVLTPAARMVHLMGKSSPATNEYTYLKNWHMMWSRLYMEKKYQGLSATILLALEAFYVSAAKAMMYAIQRNQPKALKHMARAMATLSFALGKPAQSFRPFFVK